MDIQDFLHISPECIEADSGLRAQEFARSRLGQHMSEAGLLCTGKKGGVVETEEFRFNATRLSKKGTVLLCASGFEGTSLLALVQNAMSATDSKARQRALIAIETVSAAAENLVSGRTGKIFSNCGPAGIIVGNKNSILFLPPTLLARIIAARNKKQKAFLYGSWVQSALEVTASLRFTLSACVYAVLIGKVPFEEADEEKRNEDFCDNNFIPLKYLICAQDSRAKKILEIIDADLSIGTQVRQKAGRTQAEKQNISSTALSDFAEILSTLCAKKNTMDDAAKKELDTERAFFVSSRQKKLKRRRFVRKHGIKVSAALAAAMVIIISAISIISSNSKRPTTEGMTAVEVVHTFYSALNKLDTIALDSCGSSKAVKKYSNMAATLFVTGKMRQAYENTPSFLPPEQWLNTYNPLNFWVFGLTHLSVESRDPAAYKQSAKKGDTAEVTARFFILTNEGQNNYQVSSYTDRIILTYGKKHWQISAITGESKDEQPGMFAQDIKNILATEAADKTEEFFAQERFDAVEKLAEVYPWLPKTADMLRARTEVPEYYLYPPK